MKRTFFLTCEISSPSNPGRSEQFLSQSWFQDGLTEEEAALDPSRSDQP